MMIGSMNSDSPVAQASSLCFPPHRLEACATWLVMLIGLLALAGCGRDDNATVQGYVEGEYVYVSSPLPGALLKLHVDRGQQVKAGDPLFELESTPELSARDQAKRQLEEAKATLADVRKGQRPTEIAALEAQIGQAKASLAYSESEYARLQPLEASGGASVQEMQKAQASRDADRQRVAQFEAQLKTAQLGARSDQVEAADALVRAREAALAKAEWDLSQKKQSAPQAGLVFDTLFREGEQVGASKPVVSLLPPGNVKVRAFVPQARLGTFKLGDAATVTADGISGALSGKVSFISPTAEYTPPVIYSKESRDKLVFMIEISFDAETGAKLHPGQPVDVQLK